MKLNDRAIVSIVTGISLIALVAVLKNIILVPAEILSRDIIVYIIVYIGFLTTLSAKEVSRKKSRCDNPFFWSALIVLVTLAIIAIYAI
jgi:hypothetical protein